MTLMALFQYVSLIVELRTTDNKKEGLDFNISVKTRVVRGNLAKARKPEKGDLF